MLVSLSHSVADLIELTTASFWKEDENADQERDVRDPLNALDPPPSQILIDESSVDWCKNSAKDGNEREHGHRS